MELADQSVTRHAAASRAAYETLFVAFASQPGGIKDSHCEALETLSGELRLDQGFTGGVAVKHGKRRGVGRGGQSVSGGSRDEACGGGDAGVDGPPAIQIAWTEARKDHKSIFLQHFISIYEYNIILIQVVF